jgi:hypothetical protein
MKKGAEYAIQLLKQNGAKKLLSQAYRKDVVRNHGFFRTLEMI